MQQGSFLQRRPSLTREKSHILGFCPPCRESSAVCVPAMRFLQEEVGTCLLSDRMRYNAHGVLHFASKTEHMVSADHTSHPCRSAGCRSKLPGRIQEDMLMIADSTMKTVQTRPKATQNCSSRTLFLSALLRSFLSHSL